MAKTWRNYKCTFETHNTSNDKGDSRYIVTESDFVRLAAVNLGTDEGRQRPVKQAITNVQGRAICYLKPGSVLSEWIMESEDNDPTVDVVNRDLIIMKMGNGNNAAVGVAYRKPMVGYLTFDFGNANGTLSSIHVGHAVSRILKEEAFQTDPENISLAILMFHIRNVKDFGLEGIQGSQVGIKKPLRLDDGIKALKKVPGPNKRYRDSPRISEDS